MYRYVLQYQTYVPVYDGLLSHLPGAIFQARLLHTGRRMPKPNDASSASSRRDVSNADVVGPDAAVPTVEISSMENWSRGRCGGVVYTVVRNLHEYV